MVAQHCALPYVSTIREIAAIGSHIYGIELQLPSIFGRSNSQNLFFWAPSNTESVHGYEVAALQALATLQNIYGFVILDHSLGSMSLYRSLAHWLFPVANRGVQLARMVITSSHQYLQNRDALLSCAEELIQHIGGTEAPF